MSSDRVPLLAITISLAGVIGIFVGSFLNVVVYRAPLGLSVSAPVRSAPPAERQLSWWENIPVVSWVALRGRCRTCHLPISVRYPLVELTTGIAFALVTWAWHGTSVSAAYCCLGRVHDRVGLIEYGGQRAPLSVAAIGTGAGPDHHPRRRRLAPPWGIVVGSLFGTLIAVAVFAGLRAADPECLIHEVTVDRPC